MEASCCMLYSLLHVVSRVENVHFLGPKFSSRGAPAAHKSANCRIEGIPEAPGWLRSHDWALRRPYPPEKIYRWLHGPPTGSRTSTAPAGVLPDLRNRCNGEESTARRVAIAEEAGRIAADKSARRAPKSLQWVGISGDWRYSAGQCRFFLPAFSHGLHIFIVA